MTRSEGGLVGSVIISKSKIYIICTDSEEKTDQRQRDGV